MASKANTAPPSTGVIRAGESYPLEEFKRRAGLSRHTMKRIRERGFPVRRCGNRGFVVGDDWLAFLASGKADVR